MNSRSYPNCPSLPGRPFPLHPTPPAKSQGDRPLLALSFLGAESHVHLSACPDLKWVWRPRGTPSTPVSLASKTGPSPVLRPPCRT